MANTQALRTLLTRVGAHPPALPQTAPAAQSGAPPPSSAGAQEGEEPPVPPVASADTTAQPEAPLPQRPTQLASLLLLKAWQAHPEGLYFSAGDLEELIVLLDQYLTLLPGTAQAEAVAEATEAPDLAKDWWQHALDHWLAIVVAVLLILIYPICRSTLLILRGLVNFRYVGLMREAEAFLNFLSYSSSQERSAGFAFRGFKLAGKQTVTARDLTLESLTARYLDFVQLIVPYYNNKMIIVIDELDKVVEPAQVRDFLLELKGALFGRGCFYLISISEDAARAFRGRLSEGRDIFESTFDYVVEIDRMGPEAAEGMIRKRLDKSPKSPRFLSLIHI